ncbi:hypothetical protein ACW7BJ_14135 [Azospirillum argentinense]
MRLRSPFNRSRFLGMLKSTMKACGLMAAANRREHVFRMSRGPVSADIADFQALLPGPRGLMEVMISVRLFEKAEVWLYAADCMPNRPMRGLWRWQAGVWETLSAGEGFDPYAIVGAATKSKYWESPSPTNNDRPVRHLLHLASCSDHAT